MSAYTKYTCKPWVRLCVRAEKVLQACPEKLTESETRFLNKLVDEKIVWGSQAQLTWLEKIETKAVSAKPANGGA